MPVPPAGACILPIQRGREQAFGPERGEAQAGCMEEAAFQLGLRCLEGLGRRKSIAGGSEGGVSGRGAEQWLWACLWPFALLLLHTCVSHVLPHQYVAEEGTDAQSGQGTGPGPEGAGVRIPLWGDLIPGPCFLHKAGALKVGGAVSVTTKASFIICKVG